MNSDSPSPLPSRHPATARVHRRSRWFPVFIGAFLVILGGTFTCLLGRSFTRALDMRSWPRIPCMITGSRIVERKHDAYSREEFRHEISYSYTWQGVEHTGKNITLRGSPWSSHKAKSVRSYAAWPAGARTTCLVDSKAPARAVLQPDSLAPGYSIWFPALFVIGGAGIIRSALRGSRTIA
ncbi:MAG: DUF3592 domain-containing protein [Verrucomicrobiota bacterium]